MEQHSEQKFRVLIADDEALIRKLVSEFLQGEGHKVDQAVDGSDAWEQLANQQYDYVILDLRMPKLNGLEVLRLMRRLKLRPRVILVTGEKTTYIEKTALTLGAAGCYQKPLSLDKLLADLIWAPCFSGRPSNHLDPSEQPLEFMPLLKR